MVGSGISAMSDSGLTRKAFIITTIGLYKTAVGSGVLSMPKALSSTGIVMFAVLLVVFSALSSYSCSLVAKTLDLIDCRDVDPAKIGEFSLGKKGKYLTLVLAFLDPWGSCMAFFSTLADTLRPMLEEKSVLGDDSFWTKDAIVVAILAVSIFPLTLTTRITEIGWVNVFGTVALVAFVFAVLVNTIQHGQSLSGTKLASVSTDSIVALTVISFAFDGCQMNVFPFYRDLPNTDADEPKSRTMIKMTWIANSLAAFSYLFVAILGFSSYKDDTKNNILKNLDNSGVDVTIKLALSLSMLLSIPITLFECSNVFREVWKNMLFGEEKKNVPHYTQHVVGKDNKVTNLLLNLALVGSSAVLAVAVTEYVGKKMLFFCYAHYFASGKCHVVHSPNRAPQHHHPR